MYRRLKLLTSYLLLSCAAVAFGPAAYGTEVPSTDQARTFYLRKCSKCHRLYDPMEYDDENWTGWMQKMKKKAKLTDEDFKTISGYLESLRKNSDHSR